MWWSRDRVQHLPPSPTISAPSTCSVSGSLCHNVVHVYLRAERETYTPETKKSLGKKTLTQRFGYVLLSYSQKFKLNSKSRKFTRLFYCLRKNQIFSFITFRIKAKFRQRTSLFRSVSPLDGRFSKIQVLKQNITAELHPQWIPQWCTVKKKVLNFEHNI